MSTIEKDSDLVVQQAGRLIVVSFESPDLPAFFDFTPYKHKLARLIEEHNCEEFAFNPTDVRTVSSSLLALMILIHRLGVRVVVYNPPQRVEQILQTTRLDQFILPVQVGASGKK